MKKPTETFPLIPPQETISFMLKYSLHKQVTQIPASVIVNKKIDFEIMQKAFEIHIQRNDCFRLRFIKSRKTIEQYFIDSFTPEPVKVLSFDTQAQCDAYLEKDASTPISAYKGETYRAYFFTISNKKYGVYLNVSHLCMDAAAVFLFFSDIFAIYDSLKSYTPMPAPLGSYRDIIIKELAYINNPDRVNADKKAYTEYLLKDGAPYYAGVHGPELLDNERKKKNDLSIRVPSAFDLIHDKAVMSHRRAKSEDAAKFFKFCEENAVSPDVLTQFGMRTHVSYINHREPDVYFMSLCSRRSTLKEKRTGGTTAQPLPSRVVITQDMTFMQALQKISEAQSFLFRHGDYPYLESRKLCQDLFSYSMAMSPASMMFSWFPLNEKTVNGWQYEFKGYNLGRYVLPIYTFAMKSVEDGGLKFAFLYRTNMISEKNIDCMAENCMKIIVKGIENPQITVGEIMDFLDRKN